MITLLSVNIEGYCSICEPTHLQLNQGCTVLIKAPNGNGKSSIFGAIVWCIYGKSLKGVSEVNTWKEVQPKDYAGTKVELFFQKDKDIYKIIRCQNYKKILDDGAKGNSRLVFYENGDLVNIKSKIKLQETINLKLGLSYQLFINSIMFGQGLQRLITESNTDKKKLFEEIFDLNFLNIAKDIAQGDWEQVISESRDIEYNIKEIEKEIVNVKNTYNELKVKEKSWETTITQECEELKEKRIKLTKRLQKEQRQVKEEITLALDVKVKNQVKLVSNIKEKLNNAKRLSKVPLEEFIDIILELMQNKNYKEAYESILKIKKAFGKITKYQNELDKANDRLYELKETQRKLYDIKETCDEYAEEIVQLDSKIRKLGDKSLEILSPKYKKKLVKLNSKLKEINKVYQKKLINLKNYEWLLKDPLGNNGIKAYLFDSSLDLLNNTLDSYSEVLGFRISFEIDLSSTRKDFVTLIERGGIIIDYDELSGGEKQVCNLAMAFAMFESMSAARGINIAFLDEVFESLSSDNIEIVISLIKHIFESKTLFLITHHDSLPLSHSKILQVEKQNGLTSLKQL